MNNTLPAAEGRRARKKRETRERILNVASSSFNAIGFEATTVEAIAEGADISRPTLFNYFPSKMAILQALLPEVDRHFAAAVTRTDRDIATIGDQLQQFFAYITKMTQKTPQLTQSMLIQALRAYEDPRDSLVHHRFPKTRDAFIALLEDATLRGEIRSDFNAARLTDYITGIYVYGLLNWLANPEFAAEEEFREAARFLTAALVEAP